MTTITVRKQASEKQVALIGNLEKEITALGIKDATKSAWHASGAIGRAANPSQAVIGALDALNARPFYARSSREAEWQAYILKALRDVRENNTEAGRDVFIKAVAEMFERRAQA